MFGHAKRVRQQLLRDQAAQKVVDTLTEVLVNTTEIKTILQTGRAGDGDGAKSGR